MTDAAQTPATERLRAFEDEKLGADAVRIGGRIERGYGSKFKDLPQADQDHYAKFEKLVDAEQTLNDARAELAIAQNEYDAALKAVEEPADAVDAAPHE